ncbi:Ear1p NDAI_0H03270 [Naumovozyma dairenensis CBS 421]|uniref:B30.2/SPRY domain-containing protein n=1 Tax=Naumovozyma dairenensis (strain ATCC 10597 / BCRC 20456 / CBS 421 / NBRC 0211 / NRRL Y-12639) TaxID=1071378 RepID=G0WFD9_NAUDC|nr:hypothetical protein NDAI_0H03270 [Naumovozyma dairenensis CBS 421]CCD26500.1 hypothetical protein NDAI_0H03270 [Naumovozyma dairenensis CBS 421]
MQTLLSRKMLVYALLQLTILRSSLGYVIPKDKLYIGNDAKLFKEDENGNDSYNYSPNTPQVDDDDDEYSEFESLEVMAYVLLAFILLLLVREIICEVVIFINRRITLARSNRRISLFSGEEYDDQEAQTNIDNNNHSTHLPSRFNIFSHFYTTRGTNDSATTTATTNNNNDITASLDTSAMNYLDDSLKIQYKLSDLSPEEQFYYKQGEDFLKQSPPFIIPSKALTIGEETTSSDELVIIDPIINQQTKQFIEEEGAGAWEFQPNSNLPNDTIIIENKTEITFLNYNYDASIMTNLPIPCIKQQKVYYLEFKIFELENSNSTTTLDYSNNEILSFGLATNPYPYFRLPGRHHHSISYDSNGARRFNDSFKLPSELSNIFPQMERGDVIGIGYRVRSGTVFFTRNGKKLNEKPIGGHIKNWKLKYIYPIVGTNVPCKIHVNLGTYGFVFTEANVKKWGYAKSHGKKLPPPSYDEYAKDTLIGSYQNQDDEDDDDDEEEEEDSDEEVNDYELHTEDDDNSDDSGEEGEDPTDDANSSIYNGLRNDEGELLPPPPGFEFSTTPESRIISEEINLNSLPAEPPRYSQDFNQYSGANGKGRLLPSEGRSKDLMKTGFSLDEIFTPSNNETKSSQHDDNDEITDEAQSDDSLQNLINAQASSSTRTEGAEESDSDTFEEEETNELQHLIDNYE